jgi:DNA-binding NtrC family response regulator
MTARILVVDDEPDVEALILQRFRYKIRDEAVSFLFARDGVEALATLKANGNIDLVVTDINMPRMDGLSLLQKLQESEQNVSTIIVSAYGDMANIRAAMNRGAFDFVTKPIDFLDLETTIAKTAPAYRIIARRASASGSSRTGLCLAVALLLAEPCPGARLRHGCHRPRRAAPRDCDPFYRHHQFHRACGDAGTQRPRTAAQ